MENKQKFKIGDKVKVICGRYKGKFGTIKDIADFRLYNRLTYRVKFNTGQEYDESVFVSYELEKMDMTGKEPVAKQENQLRCIIEFDCNPIDRFGTMQIKDIRQLATKITINNKVISNRYGNSGGIEKHLVLPLEEAQKMYKAGGTFKEFALKVFTEEELNPVPYTWKDYCKNAYGKFYYIDTGRIEDFTLAQNVGGLDEVAAGDMLPSKEMADAVLAFKKLLILRNAWIKKWEADWNNDNQEKYYLKWCFKNVSVFPHRYADGANEVMSFPTIEMARKFKDCFNDLLTAAKNLY